MDVRFKSAGRLSHAYIISAADMAEALDTAWNVAAAAVCQAVNDVPCGVCRACRKARDRVHPDITLIEREKNESGAEKREIGVDQIRSMAADAIVIPNESERKAYIIKDADLMNVQAQNAALKLLEEPPKGLIFLLCVRNAQSLLETIRSRCAEISCGGDSAEADEDIIRLAGEYLKTVGTGDRARLMKWCCANEELNPRECAAFCDCVTELCADTLCGRRDRHDMSAEQLMRIAGLMKKCGDYLRVNVGVKHIFGLLAVDSVRSVKK